MASLDAMAVFAAVVEQTGFAAAAQHLGISTPVVSKRVSALEDALGARLLNRTTRRLSLTEAGAIFYQHCARVVAEAREAEAAVIDLNTAPRGLLRVTAPVTFGAHQIARALPDFLATYPEIQVEMDLSDRQVDLAEDGYDLAIRITQQPQPFLSARHLASTRRVPCAAPGYWQANGRPSVPADLADHNCIVYRPNPTFNHWYFIGPEGPETIPVTGSFSVNNTEAMLQAAIGGLGVIMLTSFTVDRAITDGLLEPVLEAFGAPDTDIYALYLPNRHLSIKARVFIDYLVDYYAQRRLD